jgi:hypothetical protein
MIRRRPKKIAAPMPYPRRPEPLVDHRLGLPRWY